VVYYGKATPEVPIMVEKSTLTETDTSLLKVFTCYAYQPETPIKDDNTDPSFDYIGFGFCRDSVNNNPWLSQGDDEQCGYDLPACQGKCKALDKCVGITWTGEITPACEYGPRCVVYMYDGEPTPVPSPVEKSMEYEGYDGFKCYAYQPETLTMDGECVVKKEKKHGYQDCSSLDAVIVNPGRDCLFHQPCNDFTSEFLKAKKKCTAEVLCEWNGENNECAHVCDGKEKKQCKKPTFQGKKICKFKKNEE